MLNLHKRLTYEDYISEFEKVNRDNVIEESSEKIEVSKAISSLALAYEKVRNVIDYKDEHLIRRFAIERELRRLFGSNGNDYEKTAEQLIRSLIRGNYLLNNHIPVIRIKEVARLMEKYVELRKTSKTSVSTTPTIDEVTQYTLEIMSSEVEKILVPTYVPEITSVYMASVFEPHIKLETDSQDGLSKLWPVTVLATHKATHKSDLSSLKYFAFVLNNPDWHAFGIERVKTLNLDKEIEKADFLIRNPAFEKVLLFTRKYTPSFAALENVAFESIEEIEVLRDEETLLRKAQIFLNKAYENTSEKLKRRVTRSIMYIFVTKMLLAIAIEVPVDRYLEGGVNYVSVGLNIMFPPLLLFLVAMVIQPPGDKNTRTILQMLKTLKDGGMLLPMDKKILVSFKPRVKTFLDRVFMVFYLLMVVLVIWISYTVLTGIGYNIVSYGIFMFFLCIVSFFAYSIAVSASEYKVVRESDGGFLIFIMDSLTLPIIRVGRNLSDGVSKINLFVFVLDVLIESPFKLFVEFLEQWLGFVREKREETIA